MDVRIATQSHTLTIPFFGFRPFAEDLVLRSRCKYASSSPPRQSSRSTPCIAAARGPLLHGCQLVRLRSWLAWRAEDTQHFQACRIGSPVLNTWFLFGLFCLRSPAGLPVDRIHYRYGLRMSKYASCGGTAWGTVSDSTPASLMLQLRQITCSTTPLQWMIFSAR